MFETSFSAINTNVGNIQFSLENNVANIDFSLETDALNTQFLLIRKQMG